MNRLFYGVAVSALVLGAGGAALACDKHAKSAALENPAAATHVFNAGGIVLAQAQQEEQSGTSDEDTKESKPEESKPETLPNKAVGPLAQMQQQDEQSGTTGEDTKESKHEGEDQK